VRHPHHPSLRIPAAFVALRDHILSDHEPGTDVFDHAWRRVGMFFCGDLTTNLLTGEPDDRPTHPELIYHYQPVEIVPFCRAGVDALHYGWAVLAPELDLDDQPCVSFAPVDDEACWLGDTTHQALENLLTGHLLGWAAWGRAEVEPSPDIDPRWRALCDTLGLRPVAEPGDITAGARSPRALRPVVPPGWHYEPSVDGVGVLAPAAAFAPDPIDLVDWHDVDERIATGRQLISAGHPASAVEVLKSRHPEPADMRVLRDAYRALGRDLHVERAEIWLDRH
jgi:hypothetical protein